MTRLGPESPQPTTPLVFDNLLVQYVDYEPQGTMALLNAALIGEGEALLFTRGVCIPCRWVRESYADRTRFISKSGRELALSTGKTYIAHFPTQQGAVIVE